MSELPNMRYDIVYSVCAHESHECVYNLYENILKFNEGLSVLVVFHTNQDLLKDCKYFLPEHDNLIFHPRPTIKARFTSSIFLGHLENYRLIAELDFVFFCPLASNCLFVRPIDFPAIQKNTPHLNITRTGYKMPDPDRWMHSEFMKNERLAEVFKERNLEIKVTTHEGAYYHKVVIEAIDTFCRQSHINKDIFTNDCVAFEEILFPSIEKFITGTVGKRYCGWIPGIKESDVQSVIKTGTCKSLSPHYNNILKVPRDMENGMRKLINNIQL